MTIKDNTHGLGTNLAKDDELRNTQRLGAYQDILSRLNGKKEAQINGEQDSRPGLSRQMYVEQKYGTIQFVRGGFLVDDKVESSIPPELDQTAEKQANRVESSRLIVGKCEERNLLKEERRFLKKERRQQKKEARERQHAEKIYHHKERGTIKVKSGILGENSSDSRTAQSSTPSQMTLKRRKRSPGPLEENDIPNNHSSLLLPDSSLATLQDDQGNRTKKVNRASKKARKGERSKILGRSTAPDLASANEETTSSMNSTQDGEVAALVDCVGRSAMKKRSVKHKRMAGTDAQALREVSGDGSRGDVCLFKQILMLKNE